jgi:hypothetical protein
MSILLIYLMTWSCCNKLVTFFYKAASAGAVSMAILKFWRVDFIYIEAKSLNKGAIVHRAASLLVHNRRLPVRRYASHMQAHPCQGLRPWTPVGTR